MKILCKLIGHRWEYGGFNTFLYVKTRRCERCDLIQGMSEIKGRGWRNVL